MAAYEDPEALFASLMADVDGDQSGLQNEDDFVDAPEHPFEHGTAMEDVIFEPSNDLDVSGGLDEVFTPLSFDQNLQIESQSSDQINNIPGPNDYEAYHPSTFEQQLHIESQGSDQIGTSSGLNGEQQYEAYATPAFDQQVHIGSQGSDQVNTLPGLVSHQSQNQTSYYSSAAEPVETINVSKQSASEKHTAAYYSILKKTSNSSQGEHTPGCSNTRSASTPPATPPHPLNSAPKTDSKPEQKIWAGPDDLRDLAKAFQREKRWHEKVAHLHPSFVLPPHRYWIGILNPGLVPRTACKEGHFTWMKGNKYTTVETIRRVYASVTMKEGAFMLGGERPKDEDCVESLDLFNDKIVLFTIADEGTPAAVGRKITEGLVPELVELDD